MPNNKRTFTRVYFGLGVVTLLSLGIYVGWRQPSVRVTFALIPAVRAYIHDQLPKGMVPVSVSLSNLVNSGYIEADDAHLLAGSEVAISITLDDASALNGWVPEQKFLIRIRMPDGKVIERLADGK